MQEPIIAADLSARAQAVAAARGEGWVKTAIAGRDADLTAAAPTAATYANGVALVTGVEGVRLVNSRGEVRSAPKPYVWRASRGAAEIALGGFAPDGALRDALVAEAGKVASGIKANSAIELADGAPAGFEAMAKFALAQMARLATGEASLSDGTLTITGRAASAEAYAALQAAVKSLPQGVALGGVNIAPQTVSPYVWNAEKSAAGLSLGGFAPDDAARNAAVTAARGLFSGGDVRDGQQPGSGQPSIYARAVQLALAVLARLDEGKATLADTTLTITGKAGSDAAFAALQALLADARGAGLTVASSVVAPPPPPPPPPAPVEAQPSPVAVRAPDAANAAAQDCGAKLREAIGGRMVYFDRSMRQVRAEGQPLIRSLAAVLRDCSKVSIMVEGHTDADGGRSRNQRLSENRAAEVVKALRAAGAPETGLASAGFGASRPVAANANADDKAKNRRVEIVIR